MRAEVFLLLVGFACMAACAQKGGASLFDERLLDRSFEQAGFKRVGEPPQTVFVDHLSGRVEKKCFKVSKSLHEIKICLQKFPDFESAMDAGSQLGMNAWTGNKKIMAFIRDNILVAIYGDEESGQDMKQIHQILMKIKL